MNRQADRTVSFNRYTYAREHTKKQTSAETGLRRVMTGSGATEDYRRTRGKTAALASQAKAAERRLAAGLSAGPGRMTGTRAWK
ncbi:MAG: hypothetical protein NTNFB01_21280 [Nitrospira sp.]